ncbi:coproporphyrinogen III oxidase [Desulfosarcina ovata subsp. sediminis]|uniref:Heme chaperone HemW n=1 Tax=Desulfosarcina ovata subsp. sediminis TaxID=885957 RepID=A0A5K7ZJZ3_9BACT|nr:radical SAM family heme chaperone HemW [Desulfosarcina ovata]BBO81211.1 coproporphyrinogen III oxidase [Desulfosarcina ovata subsp. sediminis]
MQNERATDTQATLGTDIAPAGIYIHVPFCRAKCPYCDFYSVTDSDRIPNFVDALLKELKRRRGRVPSADTVYFGGGTPSILTPGQIERILGAVHDAFNMMPDSEVTLEVNPGTVSLDSLHGFRNAGINRLNIGLQSTNDRTLGFLGRIHTAEQARNTYRWARQAGFDNVGLDLIYGIPGQSREAWRVELADVIRLESEHLSCYTLTLEPGTPMADRVNQGRIPSPDEAVVGDLFVFTCKWLDDHGYRQYEISNFARKDPGKGIDLRSRHNRKYWNFIPYLGFGPAAHSFLDQCRWWNHRHLAPYLADVAAGRLPVAETERLTRDQQLIEAIYLGLRQTDGIDTVDFRQRFAIDFFDHFRKAMVPLIDGGLIQLESRRVRLTAQGMGLLERVAGAFIQALE